MISPAELKREIEGRLKKYLSRDKTGIRHEVLTLFVKLKSLTIADIHQTIKEQFDISYQSVASMVGIIASRIGILHVQRNKDNTATTYLLKDQYRDLVRRVIAST
jgi:predicted transcriptional regulator